MTELTPEFTYLGLALVLALVQIGAAAMARTAELGAQWNAGARDEPAPPPGRLAGRLMRAQSNLFETLPLFAAAILMAEVAGRTGGLSLWGAGLYFFGRLVYVPLYALGVPYVRSLVWLIATGGLGLVLVSLFV